MLVDVGVLIFIDEKVTQMVLSLQTHLFTARRQLGENADQAIEIHCLIHVWRRHVVTADERRLVVIDVTADERLGNRRVRVDETIFP